MTRRIPEIQFALASWFADNTRDLPWRDPDTTAWGVLVSEIMLQQTPASRVAAPWVAWMERWPTPADVAAASRAEIIRAWDRLGYPRRALRLQATAQVVLDEHGGIVPEDEDALRALPGIGRYTAAAVMAFAFGRRSLVLDVNIRRTLARVDGGVEHPARSETAAERRRAWEWVPDTDADAATWSAAAMEHGAVTCTAARPRCGSCPIAGGCAWMAAGRPAWDGPERVAQAWEGTNRQCRGRIMASLRAARHPVPVTGIAWPDPEQLAHCAASLVADGLVVENGAGLTLPE